MPKVSVGVIGCGYWGPNLVRSFLEIPDATVTAVGDRDYARLDHVRTRHPHIEHYVHDYRELFDMALDVVVIVAPPETHHQIAKELLIGFLRICLRHLECVCYSAIVFLPKPANIL